MYIVYNYIFSKNRVWETHIACNGLYFIGKFVWDRKNI